MTPPSPLAKTLAAILTGVLLISVIPRGPVGHLAFAQETDSSIEFAENGKGTVGTFRARDQDDESITWSLGGPDSDLFSIGDGVLGFREPPDYEDPQSAAGGNVYRVTIRASGGTHDVTVTVTDVDEPGTVNISRLQPQVSRPLSANLSDVDDGVTAERWQWARSDDRTTWTDIGGATSPNRVPAPADEGMYLRATVTYSDKFGSNKSASAVAANRVEARTLSNAAPSFAAQDREGDALVLRSIRENAAVGRSVGRAISATDADEDILFYDLLDTPDLEDGDGAARFMIDSRSGQIRVGKELGADDGQREDDAIDLTDEPPIANAANNNEYVLRVRVSDPSTASATVNVIVRVTDLNEAPEFDVDAPTELWVLEGPDPVLFPLRDGTVRMDADVVTYAVTDQDGADTARRYSVTGDDSAVFAISDDGILSFTEGHEPDFENKSSYSMSVVARSGVGSRRRTATLDVTINVGNDQDAGEVVLSQREPQVGTEVYATVDDPDGGVIVTGWVWERSEEITEDADGNPTAECRGDPDAPGVVGGWTEIPGATSAVYTPMPADANRCLRTIAAYRDDLHRTLESGGTIGSSLPMAEAIGTSEAPVQRNDPANAAPKFVDQDLTSAGNQSARTSRKVAENTEAERGIGSPVTASDEDMDLLIYSLGGADAEFFGISRTTGQLLTKAALNYEARKSYSVIVIATDPSAATDSIPVTINVTDVHDPVNITGALSVNYAENGTDPVASYSAFDEEGHAIEWTVGGPDGGLFTVDGGVLSFVEPPDYERPESASNGAGLAARNVYRVTVRAAGGTRSVAVTVTDVDEGGTVRIDRPQPQVDRPLTGSLFDEDGEVTDERWQWASSLDGRTWTDIEGAISPGRTPTEVDVGVYLRASVTYSDIFGVGKTASAVSANPVEPRTLFNDAPSFSGQDEDETTPYIDISRSIPENTAVGMPIGEPVTASDANEDLLFYELLDTPDLRDSDDRPRFTIDSLSGQLRVGKVLGADAALEDLPTEREDEASTTDLGGPELPAGEDAQEADNSEYVLRVRVSDPSTAADTVNVIVTVAEVNEAPLFGENAPTLLSVLEIDDPEDTPVIRIEHNDTPVDAGTYAVTDQDGSVDGPVGYDPSDYRYSVSGPDGDYLAFSDTRVLSFREGHEPDFEDRSSYSITIEAHSGEGERSMTATLDVTIEVLDGEDAGAVILSQRQPEVGIEVHATASDDDGGVTIKRWRWELSDPVAVNNRAIPLFECKNLPDDETWNEISGASSAVYTPTVSDAGRCLRTTAVYTDNIGNDDDEATGVLEVPVGQHGSSGTDPASDGGFVNAAPVFPDQDHHTEGDQSETTTREIAENTEAGRSIGEAVSASDDDRDLLIYTLGGVDAASFSMMRYTGQLMTKADLNYEDRSSYTVVVTVTDPFGATDSIVVTISVTDEDDPAEIRVLDD